MTTFEIEGINKNHAWKAAIRVLLHQFCLVKADFDAGLITATIRENRGLEKETIEIGILHKEAEKVVYFEIRSSEFWTFGFGQKWELSLEEALKVELGVYD